MYTGVSNVKHLFRRSLLFLHYFYVQTIYLLYKCIDCKEIIKDFIKKINVKTLKKIDYYYHKMSK